MDILGELLRAMDDRARPAVTVTWGQVTSVSPVEVTFAGDTSGVAVALRADGYTPTLNDKVLMLKVGAQWVILTKVVST